MLVEGRSGSESLVTLPTRAWDGETVLRSINGVNTVGFYWIIYLFAGDRRRGVMCCDLVLSQGGSGFKTFPARGTREPLSVTGCSTMLVEIILGAKPLPALGAPINLLRSPQIPHGSSSAVHE
ncbi:MAG: hypothetical protein RBG13Loki_0348 [Promethearchaeota archaeon CR_4]|nr:MAG: hypothetical protein RBG13Loki_0348 [Candidatus Lokiarchaeota archaeon CR_4]